MSRLGLLAVVLVPAFSPAAQAAPQTEVERLYATAQKAMLAGHMDEARTGFEKLAKLAPSIAEVHASLGAINFQLKRFSEALHELDEAHRLKPTLPGLDGLIAMSQAELGHFEEALPALEATYKGTDDPQIKRISGLELERAYAGSHRDADAVELALAMQKQFPNDPEVLYRNERIFGSFAYSTVQKLVEVAPDSVWRHQAQAEAQEAAGAHDAAIEEYRRVLAIDPNRAGIHYRIGRSYRESARDKHRAGDLDHAMEEFQAELKIDPDNASAFYEIGELHRISGEVEAAQKCFIAAVKIYPDFPEAELGLGTVLATLQRPAEALPYLISATQHDPDDEATWYRLSQVQRSLGHTAEAKDALARFQALRGKTLAQQASPRDVTRQEIDSASTQ